MNYPAAELRGIKMNFYLINPDAEHRGILLIKIKNCRYSFKNQPSSIPPFHYSIFKTSDQTSRLLYIFINLKNFRDVQLYIRVADYPEKLGFSFNFIKFNVF